MGSIITDKKFSTNRGFNLFPTHLFRLGGGEELIAQVLKVAWREDGVRVATGGGGAAQIQITIFLQGDVAV